MIKVDSYDIDDDICQTRNFTGILEALDYIADEIEEDRFNGIAGMSYVLINGENIVPYRIVATLEV